MTGCEVSYIRYYSKGDTVVGTKKYHKVYRQTSLDSTLFLDSKDTLRMFMRMSADSQKVIMRFVDSINGYGISEHVVGDFSFRTDTSRDTLYRPITANLLKVDQALVETQDINGSRDCWLYSEHSPSILISLHYSALKMPYSSWTPYVLPFYSYFSFIGEKQKSWFGTDLDSAGIYAYTPPSSCLKVSAALYAMDVRYKNNGKYGWYKMALKCTRGVSVESIISNSKIKIHPNPFSNSFKIEFSESIKSLKLINAQGKVFLDENYGSVEAEQEVNLEDLKPGIYFLIVNGGYSKKVVKN